MKKAVTRFLIFVMLLSLAACGDTMLATEDSTPAGSESAATQQTEENVFTTPDEDNTPADQPEESETAPDEDSTPTDQLEESETTPDEDSIPTVQLGETVSTDIVDFTLADAAFSVYANPSVDDDFLMPVASPPDGNAVFSAAVGRCFLIATITVKNNDRTFLSIGDSFGGWCLNWNVLYNGEEFGCWSFDLNNKDGSVRWGISPFAVLEKETGHLIDDPQTSNYLLEPESEVTLRFISILRMEPDSLNDSFELKVDVPNSSGEFEYYTYQIPERTDDVDLTTE